jgi:hypothetical protein
MRSEASREKLFTFMAALGARVKSAGRIYFTGGACALLYDWRQTTIDIDLKAAPEPDGFFEAIACLKDELDVNVELAAPDQFIPPLPGWKERSIHIARYGHLDFHHYDFYSQALAKIERGHVRDLSDVEALLRLRLISTAHLREMFFAIEPELIRYPALTPAAFRNAVESFCSQHREP